MVALVCAAVVREKEKSLFGNEIVELELSNLEVQPRTVAEVVEADVHCLEAEGSLIVGGQEQHEGDVLPQGACRPQIDSREIEAV